MEIDDRSCWFCFEKKEILFGGKVAAICESCTITAVASIKAAKERHEVIQKEILIEEKDLGEAVYTSYQPTTRYGE